MPSLPSFVRAIALFTVLGSTARAGMTVGGNYTQISYSDAGTWNWKSPKAGFQVRNSSTDAWNDTTYPGTPWQLLRVSCTGVDGYSVKPTLAPTYTVTASADLSSGPTNTVEHDLTAGVLSVKKTETWEDGGRAVYLEFVVSNNSAHTLKDCRLVHAVDPDPDYAAYGDYKTKNDVRDVGDLSESWVQAVGPRSGLTVGYGICDAEEQEVGVASWSMSSGVTLADPGGATADDQIYLRNIIGDLPARASTTFGFVFAWDTSADGAQDQYLDMASAHCPNWSPPCEEPVSWWDGTAVMPAYDGANCWVDDVPSGSTGFIYGNQYYIASKPGKTCPVGTYDGANCYVGTVPAGTTGFVYDGKLYTTPLRGRCPIGRYDGANCLVARVPWGTKGFVWKGKLYTTPLPDCADGKFDGANCWMGKPPAGHTAFLWTDDTPAFYYDAP